MAGVIAFLIVGIKYMDQQLKKPLDPVTKQILADEVERIMAEKIFEIVPQKIFMWETFFETIDGFTKTAGVTLNPDEIEVTTTGVLDNSQSIEKIATWQGLTTLFDRSLFRTAFNLNAVTNVTAYITVGDVAGGSAGYGFKVVNSSLYGVSHNGTTETTILLQTITTDNYNINAYLNPSDKIIFLVNNIEKGVITTGLPTGLTAGVPSVNNVLMKFYVKATAAEIKSLQTSAFQYYQYRNRKTAQ